MDRRTATRAGAAIGIVVILAAFLSSSVLTTHPSTSSATGGPSDTGTPGRSSTPSSTPGATEEPWAGLDLAPYAPVAELSPTDADRIGATSGTAFTLRSLTSTPAVALAAGLQSNPPIKVSVAAGATTDVAIIRPSEPLVVGARYRFRLESPDGALAGSWTFTTRGPLHVTGTLPGDQSVAVPTNTGIELTFDQDGTTGVEPHFAITPAVAGRFEQHDRVWSFVPQHALAPATVYTVTLSRGVGLAGSDEILESGLTFQFETALPGVALPTVRFGRSIVEIRPNEEPVVTVDRESDVDEEGAPTDLPATITVAIHRLATFDAVTAAARTLVGPGGWTIASPTSSVQTDGLVKVAEIEAPITSSTIGDALRIPVKLARGFYIVTVQEPGPPAQMLVQVTNLSAYAQTATSSTVVWVNDLAADTAIPGATISIASGRKLGSTDAKGLLELKTPAELRVVGRDIDADPGLPDPGAAFLTIAAPDGRRLLVPIGMSTAYGYLDGSGGDYGASANWFVFLATERSAFRQVDTVHVYGTIRARSDRAVPTDVEIRLRPRASELDAPIAKVPVRPTKRGVFVADVAIDHLPFGTYRLDLLVAGNTVATMSIDVIALRKPGYRVEVTTDRYAYLLHEPVHVSGVATFFDGTPVPGIDLTAVAFEDQHVETTTGATGAASAILPSAKVQGLEGWTWDDVVVRPTRPEEGEISGSSNIIVFPSRSWLEASASVADGRIVLDGTLSSVDLAGVDAAMATRAEIDPAGAPIVGGNVQVKVIQEVPVRHQNGTIYDFIEKKVIPVYEYDTKDTLLTTRTLTSGSSGAFHLSIAAPDPSHSYRIIITTTDPEGRGSELTVYASRPFNRTSETTTRPFLETPEGCGIPSMVVRLDAKFKATMHVGDGSVATGGRFLFLVGKPGSVETTIQDAGTFARSFRDGDLPGFLIRAIWLSDIGYSVADVRTIVDHADKTLTVTLGADRARYQPGDKVILDVRTTGPDGAPIAADVVVQGVDEKLFHQGFAADPDVIGELLAAPVSGFLQSYRSHLSPGPYGGGCGAEGGDRDDFRDTVTFERITTDANGRGSVTFDLSDDLTSWHMTAVAISARLDSGIGTINIPVGLPFFVEATLAPEYLVGDQAVLRVRAFGGALHAGDAVRFTVSAPSLGLAATTVSGTAFTAIRVPLPSLAAGDHAIRIEGEATLGGATQHDALVRTVHVTTTRLGTLMTSYDALDASFNAQGGDGLTQYVITDAGRGRYISLLEELASSTSARFDRTTAAELARRMLIAEFGVPDSAFGTSDYDPSAYARDGIALLPYASPDAFLSARAALVAPDLVGGGAVRDALIAWADGDDAPTQEQRLAALAGLAGLGDDVLGRLRAFDPGTLTIREQLWLALGLVASGDETAARSMERALLAADGERFGPWVRLRVGSTLDNTLEASAMLLLLAGRLGDPIADDVARYIADHPSDSYVFPLEQFAYVAGMLDRVPRAAGRFAWTVDGERHEVALEPGSSTTLVLTAGQRAGFRLERLDGALGVTTTWTASGATLPSAGGITITRTITPAGNATDDRLVRVAIDVTFGSLAPRGCYRLTDLTPSGLAPIASLGGWIDAQGLLAATNWPYEVQAQRVSWCASPDDHSYRYSYAARVVSPGTYRWEPAVIQAELEPTVGASTPETTYTIR
ncbi:MAG: Ig-like domain-containing protein [Chloroflexota bacterium]